jgi:membrane associated rhomboid family serine protease
MSNRIAELVSKIPLVTVGLLALNIGIHGCVFLFSLPSYKLAISAAQILNGEFYRIITSTFTHGGLLHIFMNMSSLLQLGTSLETQFGSMQFLFLTFWSTFMIGGFYVLLSW